MRITPLDMADQKSIQGLLDSKETPMKTVSTIILWALYISGADEIHIRFDPGEQKSVSTQVRRFLRCTRGFEIMDEQPSNTHLKCLLNVGDMPLHASLNRMYLQVTSLTRDILSVFEGGPKEYLEDAEERENEVDALLYLIERQMRVLLDSHLVATRLNLTRTQAVEYSNLARSLERMMDHAFTMCHLDLEHPKLSNWIDIPLRATSNWQVNASRN